jgi:hypothetical protein
MPSSNAVRQASFRVKYSRDAPVTTSFGRLIIANPDCRERFRLDLPLNEPEPATFWRGYTATPQSRSIRGQDAFRGASIQCLAAAPPITGHTHQLAVLGLPRGSRRSKLRARAAPGRLRGRAPG